MLRVTMRVYALVALKNERGLRVNAGLSYTLNVGRRATRFLTMGKEVF